MYITGMKLTQTDAVPTFKKGAIGQDANGYIYKYVQYAVGAGAIAAVIGNAVGYLAAGGVSTGEKYQVTSDVSDTALLGAGILMSAPANGEYCWVQIKGPAILTTALVSGADGNALTLSSTTDGTLKVVGALTDAVVANCIDAGTKAIFCDFPF